MSIFYQHIGERMWMRDAPKSIGTKNDGLKRFQISDIEEFIDHLDPFEQMSTADAVKTLAPTLTDPLIFQTTEKVCASALFCMTISPNLSMRGRNRGSGMLGISS